VIIHFKFAGDATMYLKNLLSSKLEASQDMLVLSSRELQLELEETVLQDMQNRDISTRVHSIERIATIGKVSLSLNTII
jgi:hypothetical protein